MKQPDMNNTDRHLLKTAIDIARSSREHGNHPFGALLADQEGNILLRAENTVVTDRDCTGHAETNLIRRASQTLSPEQMAECTLYSSTEPCAMCAGAIFWGNIRRVVYALSEENLYTLTGEIPDKLLLACREVFARSARQIEVIRPALEEEAQKVHAGFWT